MTDEQKHAIEHAQKVLRAVKLYDLASMLATRDAAPRTGAQEARLAKFLNASAGDGYVLDGVDAGELFLELFPDYFNIAASAPRDK